MRPSIWLLGLLICACALSAQAAEVAIIIDDLGYEHLPSKRAVDLPGPVTLAFLPHTPYADVLAKRALREGKQIMLHLPMQSVAPHALGPGGLTLAMGRADFARTLRDDLASLPHVSGINNHMGSLLTQHPGDMDWLMKDIAGIGGLYFVDSRTTPNSVALDEARRMGVPATSRNIFLDAIPDDADFVRKQLRELIHIARRDGTAVAIGHPYPTTLDVLATAIPRLREEGIRLVPVSRIIAAQSRSPQWRAYSSPSPKAVKNSKPSP
ncbi:MAG: divergent polysaccharide deacetylase family protein [Acidihalobacter sp.]|jgi:uncharacterized protein|uniref:divergent polysaccharide deacetylase family protein n=1 Tax=Acidihalobacter sp. TaxID=1872108 RepID=UPI00307DDB2F